MKIALTGKRSMSPDMLADTIGFLRTLCSKVSEAELLCYPGYYEFLRSIPDAAGLPIREARGRFDASLALSMGGDGTFLRAARWIGSRRIPILGINSGHLGFLTDANLASVNADALIDDIVNLNFNIEHRSLLMVSRHDDISLDICPFALNEAAIVRDERANMISVGVRLNNAPLADYQADGLIISTPTGSTGYNMSVGGPILEPSAAVLAISPIAAHALTMRPLVIADSGIIDISVNSRTRNFRLLLDGRSVTLPIDCSLRISIAPYSIALMRRKDTSFASVLREKLLWGVDPR